MLLRVWLLVVSRKTFQVVFTLRGSDFLEHDMEPLGSLLIFLLLGLLGDWLQKRNGPDNRYDINGE